MIMDLRQQTAAFPCAIVVVDAGPRRQILWHIAPLAARFVDVKNPVEDLQVRVFSGSAKARGFGETVGNEVPFGLGEIRCISHPNANRAFCNCTWISFHVLALGCDIHLISPNPNGTSFPTVSPKPRALADPENTLTWRSSTGFFTSTKLAANGAIYPKICRRGPASITTIAPGHAALSCRRSMIIYANTSASNPAKSGSRRRPFWIVKPLKAVRAAASAVMMPARRLTGVSDTSWSIRLG